MKKTIFSSCIALVFSSLVFIGNLSAFEWDYSYFDDILVELINDASREELLEGIELYLSNYEESAVILKERKFSEGCDNGNWKFGQKILPYFRKYRTTGIDKEQYIALRSDLADIIKWGMTHDGCQFVDDSSYAAPAALHALYLDRQGLTDIPEEIVLKVKNQDFDDVIKRRRAQKDADTAGAKDDTTVVDDVPLGQEDDFEDGFKAGQKIVKALGTAVFALFLTGILTLPQLVSLIAGSKKIQSSGAQSKAGAQGDKSDEHKPSKASLYADLEKGTIAPDRDDTESVIVNWACPPEQTSKKPDAYNSITITATGTGASWLRINPVLKDGQGCKYATITATVPEGQSRSQLPLTASIQVSGTFDGGPHTKYLSLVISKSEQKLKVDKRTINLSDKHRESEFSVTITSPGNGNWKLEAVVERENGQRNVRVARKPGGTKTNALYGVSVEFPQGCTRDIVESSIKITATDTDYDDKELSTYVNVRSFLEGLSVDLPSHEDCLPLDAAQSNTVSRLNLNCRRIENEEIVGDAKALRNVSLGTFTSQNKDPKTAKKCNEAFKVAGFSLKEEGVYDQGRFAVYDIENKRSIPGFGEAFIGELTILARGASGEYSSQIKTQLSTAREQVGTKDWQKEYDNTLKIIMEHVPTRGDGAPGDYQDKLRKMLESRSKTLGTEGLVELRHRIWNIAQKLWEGTSAEAYEDYARWAEGIEDVLAWTKYAGDIAFNVLVKRFMPASPWGQEAAKFLKDALISALVAYRDGKDLSEWLWSEAKRLGVVVGDKLVGDLADSQSMAKKWVILLGYEFFKNLYPPSNKSVYDSAMEAGKWALRKVRDDAIEDGLAALLKKS